KIVVLQRRRKAGQHLGDVTRHTTLPDKAFFRGMPKSRLRQSIDTHRSWNLKAQATSQTSGSFCQNLTFVVAALDPAIHALLRDIPGSFRQTATMPVRPSSASLVPDIASSRCVL